MTTILFILVIIGIIIYNLKRRYSYWKDRGVPHVAGVSRDIVSHFREHSGGVFEKLYQEFAPHPYVGFYQAGKPSLMIRDPKLIQLILIKDFTHFMDRFGEIDENLDPLFGHIFMLGGARWKSIRAKQTQTFSSGKLKSLYFLLEECVEVFDKYLEKALPESGEVETRDLFSKFAMDVIGACAFGLNFNAIEDDTSDFRQIGRKIGTNPFKKAIKLILSSISLKIVSWLQLKDLTQEVDDFFLSITRDTIKSREKYEHKRNDFMQLLINIQEEEQRRLQKEINKSEPLFTEKVVTASVFSFFSAGYKTISTTLAFCIYELALNPNLMEKLYQEIVRVKNAHGGKINYNALKEQLYFTDSVISETMRLHTAVSALTRICTKSYEVPDSSFVIEKNMNITIPVFSLHLDPQYFPDPQKFDPYRFHGKNKRKITPGTYLPFGDGPRVCIGLRFAMMEMKAALAFVVGNYTIHATEKTEIPIKLDPKTFVTAPLHGIHLRFQKREHTTSFEYT